MRRHTLAGQVEVAGVGLHTGARCSVRLLPAPAGSGLVFRVAGVEVPATLAHAVPVPGATTLQASGQTVGTPEHLLAACRGLWVADLVVELEGPELPALDGAALAWTQQLTGAGRVDQGPWPALGVSPGHVMVAGGEVELRALQHDEQPTVSVEVDFPDGPYGAASWDGTALSFPEQVAWARTFVMADQVEALRAAGRGAGADVHNTLVVPRHRGSVDDPVAREAVVHKLLDAIGDLALVPPLAAHVVVRRGSHRVHVHGLRELLDGQSLP